MKTCRRRGHIRGLAVSKPWGSDTIVQGLPDCEITPDGIAYLCENSLYGKDKAILEGYQRNYAAYLNSVTAMHCARRYFYAHFQEVMPMG
ncbi:MAG: YjcQ family protein [Clostridia bacterium]